MRTHHWISAFALSAVLALGACGDDTEQGSREEGRATLGSESAQEQGTVANDTTPHRPGSPSTP